MKIDTKASGKVFFTGEYMALEGGKSIILSTPQEARVSLTENNKPHNIFNTSISNNSYPFMVKDDLNINWLKKDPKELGTILQQSIRKFKKTFTGKTISIDTNEFFFQKKKIGIGSSAAISVAITMAFNKFYEMSLAPQQIIDYSIETHRNAQNSKGSGFDVVASYEEARALSCRLINSSKLEYNQVELPDDLIVIAVLNDTSIETSRMIDRYQTGKEKHPSYFLKQAKKMKMELDYIHSFISKKDSNSILKHLRAYNDLLLDLDRKLNIGIFDNHDEVTRLAENEGVFYKPSGSGGGDLGLLIGNESMRIEEVCSSLNLRGFKYFQI
tara:strand:- start:1651 stop:2634 length:984 start_codon:yes stop_codon:yes gene_type:complete